MATEKIIQTRIKNKIDTLESWGKSSLKIKEGEICLATVAASAGTGLTEPVVMAKIGTAEEKTFAELPWSFYAKASDVLEAAKDSTKLTAFINNVIASADMATNEKFTELAGKVETLNGDESTAGSVAKSIKDAIDALDLANTYAAKEHEHTKEDITDFAHTHTVSEVTDFAEKVEAYDYATKTEAQGYADAKDDAIAAAKQAGDDAQADVDALEKYVGTFTASEGVDTVVKYIDSEVNDVNALALGVSATVDKILYGGDIIANVTSIEGIIDTEEKLAALTDKVGEIPADKTVVQMISDAQTAATYDDEEVRGLISDNADAIAAEKKRAEGVEAGLQTQINTIMNNPDAEGAINSINEFTQYVEDHGTIAEGFRTDIDKNKEDIAAEVKRAGDAESALSGRLDALEAIDHDHANKTVIDGITAEKVAAWDASEQNAKDYADDQIEALGLGTMSKEAATDYVKKSEATGYNDILTKTEAQGAYQAKGEYYTKTEADAEFTNATEVNGQIDAKITALDLANTYQAKGEYASAEQGGKADTAIQSVTSVAGNGIKATTDGTAVTIDWDSEVTLVFDCGNSGVTA